MKLLTTLRDDACEEAYEYFDKNIRSLKKKNDGKIDPAADGLENNDVDAFRHAYVSGVITQEYNEFSADILGRMNEYLTADMYSNSKDPRALNMDLWNNSIGREYGKKSKSHKELLHNIHNALNKGELIIDLSDTRKYLGSKDNPENKSKPIIVLSEDKNGRNQLFLDIVKRKAFSYDELVASIQAGEYPGYSVKEIKGVLTPVSNPDDRLTNNLG